MHGFGVEGGVGCPAFPKANIKARNTAQTELKSIIRSSKPLIYFPSKERVNTPGAGHVDLSAFFQGVLPKRFGRALRFPSWETSAWQVDDRVINRGQYYSSEFLHCHTSLGTPDMSPLRV